MRSLNWDTISKVKGLKDLGVPIAVIARKFEVSRTTIYVWLSKVNDKTIDKGVQL